MEFRGIEISQRKPHILIQFPSIFSHCLNAILLQLNLFSLSKFQVNPYTKGYLFT